MGQSRPVSHSAHRVALVSLLTFTLRSRHFEHDKSWRGCCLCFLLSPFNACAVRDDWALPGGDLIASSSSDVLNELGGCMARSVAVPEGFPCDVHAVMQQHRLMRCPYSLSTAVFPDNALDPVIRIRRR